MRRLRTFAYRYRALLVTTLLVIAAIAPRRWG